MFKRKTTLNFDESRISRVDFGKHHQAISLRRITIGVIVGMIMVISLTIAVV